MATTQIKDGFNGGSDNQLKVNADGSINTNSTSTGSSDVNVISSVLPGGASTSALQTAGNASLTSIDSKLTNPLPISGTVTANAGTGNFTIVQPTGTNLHAVIDSGTVAISNFPATTAVTQATSPWVVSGTVTSNIGTTGGLALDATVGGLLTDIELRASPVPISGTITANQGTSPWVVSGTVTTSPNVNIHDGSGTSISSTGSSLNVDVTNTVPVSQSGTWNVGLNSGSNTIGKVDQGTGGASAWKVDGSAVTQPISGTVTVTQTTGTNLHAVIDSGTITTITNVVHVDDNGGSLTVDNNGTFAVQAAQSGSWTVTANAGTNLNTSALALDSSVTELNVALEELTQSQGSTTSGQVGPLVLTATTTSAPTYATTTSNPLSTTTAGALRTDSSAITQPISAASLPLPTGASTAALQTQPGVDIGDVTINNTSGAGAVNVQDGGNSLTVDNSGTFAVQASQSGTWTVQQGTPPWSVGGNVASGATDSGNPVKIGGVYNTTRPSLTNGQRGDVQVDTRGAQVITSEDVNTVSQNITVQDTGSSTTTGFNNQTIITGTPTVGSVATFALSSDQSVVVQVSGTWTGTLQTEISMDGGVTYFIRPTHQTGTLFTPSNFTANFTGGLNTSGYTHFRVRAIAAITGTVIADINQTDNVNTVYVGNIVQAANIDGIKQTYLATNTFVAAATPTDIFTITGSATKTIRILRIGLTATQSTASDVNLTLLKRSTANSAGTSSTLTAVPLDSLNLAATATVRSYTANPTLGTLVGNLRNIKFVIPVVAVGGGASSQPELVEYFGDKFGQALVLRGTSEVFAVNLNAATISGNSFSIWLEWAEE